MMTHTIYRIDCVSHLSNIMWLNSRLTYHISLLDHLENKKKLLLTLRFSIISPIFAISYGLLDFWPIPQGNLIGFTK